jgi:hypothetical protein
LREEIPGLQACGQNLRYHQRKKTVSLHGYPIDDEIRDPLERLNLQPGEIVEVKNIEEILATLKEWKNRGFYYDENGIAARSIRS